MTRNRLYTLTLLLGGAGICWAILSFMGMHHGINIPTVCLFKNITGHPCPSCGTLHSIFLIIRGDFFGAVCENPLGFPGLMMVLAIPVWILYDLFFQGNSFYRFFVHVETLLKRKVIAIPLIALIVGIWIWKWLEKG